jgi:hypothetical protein
MSQYLSLLGWPLQNFSWGFLFLGIFVILDGIILDPFVNFLDGYVQNWLEVLIWF